MICEKTGGALLRPTSLEQFTVDDMAQFVKVRNGAMFEIGPDRLTVLFSSLASLPPFTLAHQTFYIDNSNLQVQLGTRYMRECLAFVQGKTLSHISLSYFTFPGSLYQIFLLYLFRLPCHLYLVIEQQYLEQLDATFLIVKVRNKNP